MRFAAPEFLALLWVVVALAVIRLAARWVRARRVRAFAAPGLYAGLAPELGPVRRGLRDALRLLALASLVLALARPQFGQRLAVLKREGIDLVVAVDTSASMLAEDLKPNRLAVARRAVVGLSERLRGDRLGIVVFSGSAFIQCPLTLDAKAARLLIDAIGPETVPDPGTALEAAIDRADQAFASEEKRFKALVLFTDGEETAGDPLAAARRAAEKGVRIFTVGLGAERGEPIPLRNSAGQVVGYKKDRSGEVVLSRLDEVMLRQVAEIGSGRYFRATPAMTELDELYAEIDRMEKREIEGGFSAHYEDRFHWFAVAAFVLLAAARLLGERRTLVRAARAHAALAVALPLGVVLALGLAPVPAGAAAAAADLVHDGNRALARGDAEAAAKRYLEALAEEPDNPVIQYNLGNALYTGQQFPDADAAYGAAVGRADSVLTGALSYNLGNSLFRQGRYGEAADAYKRVLRRNPADEDARWNLELALRKQEEEQKKEQDQQNQDQQQDQQNQDQQQEQQNQDQQQEQQNQEQQQEQQQQEQRNQEEPQQGESAPEPDQAPESMGEEQMTAAEAARLLEALGNEEQELLRERFRARGRRVDVEKDW